MNKMKRNRRICADPDGGCAANAQHCDVDQLSAHGVRMVESSNDPSSATADPKP